MYEQRSESDTRTVGAEQRPLAERLGFTPKRVLVLRALRGVGDLLAAVPALRSLRLGLPESRIELIGLPWATQFVDRFGHLVDSLVEFPGYPGVADHPVDVQAAAWFFLSQQNDRADLAIQLHGNGLRTNPFVAMLGAQRMAGFCLPGQYCPDPELFMPYPGRGSEVRRLLALTRFLGLPDTGEALEFPVLERDLAEIEGEQRASALAEGEYACFAPGAAEAYRQWEPERFAQVADALSREGLRAVLLGSGADREAAAQVREVMREPVVDLTGRLSLGGTAALMAGAAVVVTNDSGACHLADAVRAPSVTVFLGTGAERWAPLDHELHRSISRPLADPDEPYGGRPVEDRCLGDRCEYPQLHGYPWPRPDIPTEEVLQAARSVMRRSARQVMPV